ncbi:MAG: hypothetical protein Tsb0013_21710 [Phycisphaerales bacterium]
MTAPETTDNCYSPLQPGVALERLQRLSRRGKLAGFRPTGDASCEVAVFGAVYDWVMAVEITPEGEGSHLTMTTRPKRTLPVIVAVVMVLATFPGVLLTHSMLATYFSWYPGATWITCAWYIPLMLLAIPALVGQYRASKKAAEESRVEVIEKIRRAVEVS